jgi:hypothetical protein
MASVISHAAAGITLSIAFGLEDSPARFWPVAIVTAVLPGLDSFLSYFRYDPELGHRGFVHSPFLGLIVTFLLMPLFFRGEGFFSGGWFRFFPPFSRLDEPRQPRRNDERRARGRLLSPFSSKRYFLPGTPIRVSPMRMKRIIRPSRIRENARG